MFLKFNDKKIELHSITWEYIYPYFLRFSIKHNIDWTIWKTKNVVYIPENRKEELISMLEDIFEELMEECYKEPTQRQRTKNSTRYENVFFKDKKYDYIVDAIDLVTPKLDLIEFATNSKIPIISCMGTGNKINPAQFKVVDIKKTSVCPLAKIIRKELKKRRINKLKVVYSDETPRKPLNLDGGREKNKNVGSISFVPPVAGMLLASEVIKDICEL